MLITLTPLLAKFCKTSITCKAVELSSPVVGSSKKITLGSVSNSTPMDVLFRSPPEIPRIKEFPTLVFAHFYRPSSCISCSTLWTRYWLDKFLSLKLAENRKASLFNIKFLLYYYKYSKIINIIFFYICYKF